MAPVNQSPITTNKWGPQSYAKLIEMAINSTPGKQMTLQQIYNWFIQNFEYFRNRQRMRERASWQNSIRHNLSHRAHFRKGPKPFGGSSCLWTIDSRFPHYQKKVTKPRVVREGVRPVGRPRKTPRLETEREINNSSQPASIEAVPHFYDITNYMRNCYQDMYEDSNNFTPVQQQWNQPMIEVSQPMNQAPFRSQNLMPAMRTQIIGQNWIPEYHPQMVPQNEAQHFQIQMMARNPQQMYQRPMIRNPQFRQ